MKEMNGILFSIFSGFLSGFLLYSNLFGHTYYGLIIGIAVFGIACGTYADYNHNYDLVCQEPVLMNSIFYNWLAVSGTAVMTYLLMYAGGM